MNRNKMREVIVELFSSSGELAHYRQKHSAATIDAFLAYKSAAYVNQIVPNLAELFEDFVRKSGALSGAAPVRLPDLNPDGSAGTPAHEPAVNDGSVAPLIAVEDSTERPPSSSTECAHEEVMASSVPNANEVESDSRELSVVPSGQLGRDSLDPQLQLPRFEIQPTPNPGAGREDTVPRKFSFRLKGGKLQCGVPYEGRIESSDGAPGAIAHVRSVQLPKETGLQSDAGDPARLFGIPKISGDLTIGLTYCVEAGSADQKELNANFSVFVNHDPKSLWRVFDSDRGDPHWKPDEDKTLVQLSERKIVAASKRGRSHAHEGKFRDDDFRIDQSSDSGWSVIAVADGAGSVTRSRLGSKLAVGRAVEVALERLASEDGMRLEDSIAAWNRGEVTKEIVVSSGLYPVLGSAAFEACKAIEAEAARLEVAPKELSTTLLITAHKHTSFGHLFATYWVGDGGVGIYLNDGTPRLLGTVDSGEFAGQTRFLDRKVMTAEEIASRLQFAVVDDFKALIAMTDGITDPYFTTDNNLESAEYWGKLWDEITPALESADPQQALLEWLDFWSPGNHDDRTIVVFW